MITFSIIMRISKNDIISKYIFKKYNIKFTLNIAKACVWTSPTKLKRLYQSLKRKSMMPVDN